MATHIDDAGQSRSDLAAEPSQSTAASESHPAPVHSLTVRDTLARFDSLDESGLDEAEAATRREKWGPNLLPRAKPLSIWRRFLAQFLEPVIGILIFAAVISGVMGDVIDTVAILAIVLMNGIIGFVQEERAERAIAALQGLSAPLAKVLRAGQLRSIPAEELVPGDRILLESGDNIPADARLIRAFGLRVLEATLTGESVPVAKRAEDALNPATALADRMNMIYLGTNVAVGRAEAVVVATGPATELGHIAGLLERTEREPTPLQQRLAELGKVLIVIVLAICALIFVLHWLRGGPILPSLLLSVSLAVAAVPEGLPAVVTLVLAIGLQRLVRRNALVRRLPSVETLGSVTVICTDKTGTLTRNEMTVREVVTAGALYDVSGTGYEPKGAFHLRCGPGEQQPGEAVRPSDHPDLMRALEIAAWCTTAKVAPHPEKQTRWQVVGDPTEGALVVAGLKAGIRPREDQGSILCEIPFDSDRKAMSVVIGQPDGAATMYTKGAPEVVLAKCVAEWRQGQIRPLTTDRRDEIQRIAAGMAEQALRVLGLANRRHDDARDEAVRKEEGLVFVGLIGMMDPPRDEAKAAVQECRTAGIRPVMITGDHPATAMAIARQVGLARDNGQVMTGLGMDQLSEQELIASIPDTSVYARVTAEHKLRIVSAWKARGQIVAMTGDGVNDAPAMKAADIGVAMGITGTDVTKESSDMVLTDDNFASIVSAVEEGRGIFDNIQKFIHYLLASNASEVSLMLLAALVGWPAPLTAVQLLWINLVTDGLPALALGVEPLERNIMGRPPRPPHEPVMTYRRGVRILLHGLLMTFVAVTAFGLTYNEAGDIGRARTATFCTVAFTQLFFALACRSQSDTFWQVGMLSNRSMFGAIVASALLQVAVVTLPLARKVFDVHEPPGGDWFFILPLALLPVTVVELGKLIRKKIAARQPAEPIPTP